MASASVGLVIQESVKRSSFIQDFLTFRFLSVTVVEILGDLSDSQNAYNLVAQSMYMPKVGDVHQTYPSAYCNPGITITPMVGTQGEHPRQFEIVAPYEGTTGLALWTSNGALTQETASIDHNNTPCVVPVPPLSTAMTTVQAKYIGVVVKLPKWKGQPYRKCTFYAPQPDGKLAGTFAYEDKLNSLVGTTNVAVWLVGVDFERTWLWARCDITTANGVLFRIEITWVKRDLTWDEVGLWLDAQGNVLLNSDGITVAISPAIPNPTAFPPSVIGLPTADRGTPAKGWARFIMTTPADWQDSFDLDSSNAPDLERLPDLS